MNSHKNQVSLFADNQEYKIEHIIVPASRNHDYRDEEGEMVRNAVYIKKYVLASCNQEKNPVVFFHGGPGIANEEQFSKMQRHFTNEGHAFYIPEIEGSKMYSKGKLPQGFYPEMSGKYNLLDLKEIGETGLNEFNKNYMIDVLDVLNEISTLHPTKKSNVIAHSLSSHHVLRTLQNHPELKDKIASICCIAGTYDMGLNRFWVSLNIAKEGYGTSSRNLQEFSNEFYFSVENSCRDFLKSRANQGQEGPTISDKINPVLDQDMNKNISVLHHDVSNFPPILLMHAEDDESVCTQCSVLLQNKIEAANGCVYGIYFKEGGHQFIKDEGKQTVRESALQSMNCFFNDSNKRLNNEVNTSDLDYTDVRFEHNKFLKSPDDYLKTSLEMYQSTAATKIQKSLKS
jgi:pimeloyl-ACP methyl ester carboxylesterase